MTYQGKSAAQLEADWNENPRWEGIERPYSGKQVVNLRGSVQIEHTLAKMGAAKLWERFQNNAPVRALSAVTGNQAVQEVQAGLQAVYVSGWQTAADANTAGQMYPDQSLYPVDSVPTLVTRINQALQRADQIQSIEKKGNIDWYAPLVADAEAGFGGNLNAFELMKSMIASGVAGVHFEDQLSSAKKCGHMGGKVLVPISEFRNKLVAARLGADVAGTSTLLIARTDAESANLLTNDIDPLDEPFISGGRTSEGFYNIRGGLEYAIERSRAYAPYADLLWCETKTPDVGQAREFAAAIHEKYPGKMLAYNCSPSFNWKRHLDEKTIRTFQEQLGEMGYVLQFVTLSGFHALNTAIFELAKGYRERGMAAYSELQEREFDLEKSDGYRAIKHQAFVGAGYFDEVQLTVTSGESQTVALKGSTEEDQFD
ncbi:isocitrate lyase [Bradymonas sediminis]|uniref:Isocitrate lyase n=1 Tax=Bradymonas sediminis TaxID=1548548 RepID=A0A2Z4FQA6_9DELT|nr:isocitrate lyase [Bradymonas sediminis]AWV91169.1 isocitrate lyase [Bradymonas sediminis]TDP73731.1 isocitrate lyase [Bradymonas sediminis]